MANFVDVVDLDSVKAFLEMDSDDDTFDEEIETIIPFYIGRLSKLTGEDLDSLSEDDQNYLAGVIAVMIGCHLLKSNRTFGMKYTTIKVGDVTRNFARRYQTDYDSWCDFLKDLMDEVGYLFGDTTGEQSSGFRRSVTDDYERPYP